MQRIVPDPTLALFAKLPCPGAVKTRLIPELGEAAATDLYRAMLADGIARLRRFDGRSRKAEIWWSSPPHAATGLRLGETNITEHVQSGGNLGDRMASAVRYALHSGSPACVVLGVDAPTLPDERIPGLDHALTQPQSIAVIPALDGGYVALGATSDPLPLFDNISWGGDRVLSCTRERAKALGWHWFEAEPWYDVDIFDDLTRLREDCLHNTGDLTPATRAWFRARDL
jgi:rSAM/selenodomain-associated transferase 1